METERYKHSFKVQERPLASLMVYNTGVQRCESSYSWGPGVRDHYLLHYITEGKGIYRVRGVEHKLSRGDAFLVVPSETITYQADSSDPWAYCWVGFNGLDAEMLIKQTDFTPEKPVLHLEDMDTPHRLLMDIYQSRGSEMHEQMRMTGRLYLFLGWLLARAKHKAKQKVRQGHEHVRKACTYIANNFSSPISVEEVAEHVGVCRSRLYRAFQENMSVSPAQYLTRFRMQQACLLLERTDLPVKAVAVSVGFEDPLYFSRRFRELIGCTPSEYSHRSARGEGMEKSTSNEDDQ